MSAARVLAWLAAAAFMAAAAVWLFSTPAADATPPDQGDPTVVSIPGPPPPATIVPGPPTIYHLHMHYYGATTTTAP